MVKNSSKRTHANPQSKTASNHATFFAPETAKHFKIWLPWRSTESLMSYSSKKALSNLASLQEYPIASQSGTQASQPFQNLAGSIEYRIASWSGTQTSKPFQNLAVSIEYRIDQDTTPDDLEILQSIPASSRPPPTTISLGSAYSCLLSFRWVL